MAHIATRSSTINRTLELDLVQPFESADKAPVDAVLQHPLIRHITET